MTSAEYRRKLNLPPAGSQNGNQASPSLRPAQHAQQAPALERRDAGKAQGTGCPLVRFTLCRVNLLDVDAKYGCVKDLLDGLQYAGLIRGDREGEVRLEVEQVRVRHYSEQRTEIEITYQ